MDKTIFFLGKVPFGENYELMKSSEIMIHSSYAGGGLSSTVMQYMLLNTAVIASPHEGVREIVFNNETGILLKDNSEKEIKLALVKLLDNKTKRKKLEKQASEYIEKNFNWQHVIKTYEKEFKELF